MNNQWTEKQLQEKRKTGMIKDYTIQNKITHPDQPGIKVGRHYPKKNKCLDWMGWNLLYWCNENAVLLEEEYRFDEERRYRFDWAIPSLKIAVEFEGGVFMEKSGHNTATGITRDADKYNLAQTLGWVVLRFTAVNYKTMVQQLNKQL